MGKKSWKARAVTAVVMTGLMGFSAHAQDTMSAQDKAQMKQGKAVGEAAAKRTKYVGKVALFNNRQIELARVAEEQASDPRVKQFATQLREDHEKSQESLRSWAKSKQMEVSALSENTSAGQGMGGSGMQQGFNENMENAGEKVGRHSDETRAEVNKLRSMHGPEFDKAFLSRIADDQKKGKSLLEEGRKDYKNDATFLALLSDTEGMVSSNETKAKELEKQVKK
ncbi:MULTISPECIES: DUF4142 domain-containing protein [Corallococcus]|uniref:DUF4142 domain-containing protein n=1 Tax=Corallococcus TaxID=83461 RepID=UPI0011815CD9|nr:MULTISPECIES: DUF4142 domain-containing protein [Corallococcus]NBD10435.1 DUF4142 domain-containing protein [Corallococcus silvisoli]TSC27645.1 DUF4142 domain-containing protein [Corallococcus sp. Z5C101001]